MPQISLTDLVDIVSKSGTPKATKVAQVKARPDYEPAFDFYKPLRDHIIEVHRTGLDKKALSAFLAGIEDGKKRTNYPPVIDGYKKWWGRKTLAWFNPSRTLYGQQGVEVIINPELGLGFNGERHLVKLYFKTVPLSKLRVDIITFLMEISLRPNCPKGEVMSVLDVRNAKLFSFDPTTPIARAKAMVDAELAYVASLWSSV